MIDSDFFFKLWIFGFKMLTNLLFYVKESKQITN